MLFDVKPNQDFLKFISIQGNKKDFPNLEMILNLEETYPGMFSKVMSKFEKAKSYREALDENGNPIKVPWDEAFIKFYFNNKYIGVTQENQDIAQVFGERGLSQKVFEAASKIRQNAKIANVPEHILGKTLKEETIIESIEKIKKQTERELLNGKEIIEELYDKQFTYEWLSKNDPRNSIIGLFCSCCGTITSVFYGKDIAKASVMSPNVQNLIVRDLKGNIISKGTMYINKDKGYAVINDFELNEKYRHFGKQSPSNIYMAEKKNKEEQNRELIFKAFQRGLKAFIEEYNKQNPENPLTQVNVGMGNNRLKEQVERFEEATSKLTVPIEYSFKDAMQHEQYILYKKEEKQIENGGQER